ncbi:anti-CBASS protein Acb1 family protein [Enterococcus wangshanyuanii]|uniref:Anti-CBASS protein Acb1-like N-terminal domain-containing protein n=1 Tax=Enterococcus wangshanyuanii TaxID=2005703 RepID=A0ABQ1PJ42_9ENTE|nr:anti-CBASS Acb1 family protein [Enterococcus wangshanyuanii]GGC98123.1 hypothetical protein GCM10011573_29570 [Enterococcus wangshanyuanii]
MGSVKQQAKLLKLDGKEFRNDFMVGNGKGYGKDSLTRQRPGAAKMLSIADLENLYKSNSMAKNIVDIPAEDLTRSGWTIKMEDEKLKALYESKLRQLKTKDRLQKLFMYERLYGDGFVSIGIISSNKFEMSEPVDTKSIKSIPYLSAFSGKKISNRIVNEDVFSPNYGQIESFQINNRQSTKVELLHSYKVQQSIEVHHSRVLHQQDMRFEDELEGTSLLENLYDILTVVDTSIWSVGQILYDYIFKVFKSKDVTGLSKEEKVELAMVMDYKFRTEALAIIDAEESLGKESSQVSGIGDLLDFVWDYLAGAARMPKTVLKGQEGGTVTGAQYDVMNYYSRIAAMQENQLRPHLEYLMRLLMWAEDECGGPIDPDSIEWSIEFNPLWNVDSKTDADIRKLTAETDKIYIETGVNDPDEVREARFGRFGVTETSKFNADSLSEDELEAMAKIVYEKYQKDRNNGK